ncbi:NAD(P)H-dependent flavin oxidoreductase [Aquimonas sp.]|jgi:nitronate monooxygenase|uniref:NAD(P)H-dependent flavin oxidoreductase n=1 Tax=Aquimonas sp. TaxID=1872588 RepID=UPI0037BFDAD8
MPIPAVLEGRLRLPLVGAPMFIVSGPELVAAQCKAGVVGSFPSLNARPLAQLDEWLTQLSEELAAAHATATVADPIAPFAVNLIVHASNNRLADDIALVVKHKAPVVITSLSPPAEVVAAVHSYGGVVFHDVISRRHAEKAAAQGVDGLIAVCAGAGGHAGPLSPFALIREIRQFYPGTILLSGAMASGADIFAAQALGADLAYFGTRFIATSEARAVDDYKQMLVDTRAEDIVYSSLFTGVKGNYLKPSIARAGFDPDNLPEADKTTMDFGSGGNTDAKAWKDIWGAGQGVGGIDSVLSTHALVLKLQAEYHEAAARMGQIAFR